MLKFPDLSLLDFCNPAVQQDETFAVIAKTLDPPLQDILAQIQNTIIISAVSQQNESVVDFLALYHFGLDYYDTQLAGLSDSARLGRKQELVRRAIINKLNKGTPQVIKDVMKDCFNYVELVEWWQDAPGTKPYTFRLNIADPVIDVAKLHKMNRLILQYKNVRSYFAGISSFSQSSGNVYVSANVARMDYRIVGTSPGSP
jgi:phage tail P2-like protein